jgi:hypothetical protein
VPLKFSRLLLLLALVGLSATAAMADAIDPTVVIRQVDPPPPTSVTDPFGSFGVFATALLPVESFQNNTGLVLTSISLTLFGIPSLDFSPGDQVPNPALELPNEFPFLTATKTVNDDGSTTLTFFGLDATHLGLLPSVCNLDSDTDADDCVGPIYGIAFDGIPTGAFVTGVATVSAPEPATLLLLSTGFLGLAAFRKRRASLQN